MPQPVQHPPASNAPVTSSPEDFAVLRQLAETGDAAAQFAVGARYANGEGVSQDFPEAFRWFSKAAEQGHVVAQATLGAYYWAGRGVPQDLSKAYFWGLIAAAGGDQGSSYRVAALASRLSHEQVIAEQQHANEWIKSHQLSISIPTASHK
ncbi:MAG: sel1 repeat family protein [Acidobacteriales bacterium]|nr:sel1 repeat family protein [Terriglobales bacterium]